MVMKSRVTVRASGDFDNNDDEEEALSSNCNDEMEAQHGPSVAGSSPESKSTIEQRALPFPKHSSSSESASEDAPRDCEGAGIFYRAVRQRARLYNVLIGWPRTFSLLLGVFLPMLFLILLSVIFGLVVAMSEAQYEVKRNDRLVASLSLAAVANLSLPDLNHTDILTFDWIRCVPGASGLSFMAGIMDGVADEDMIPEMRYDAQKQWFIDSWKNDQERLFNLTYNNANEMNATLSSIRKATGAGGCEFNGPAAGWFWFAILSTVGYGNQRLHTRSPITAAMVYSLGFLCILAFGWILSVAGNIIAAIVDDLLVRLRLRALTRPAISCLIWGSLYYGSMGLIAVATYKYKSDRVGETDFSMGDGYWFSYISSTTIGFGDVVLDSEVFLYGDLVVFALLFLVAFVLAAAFISRLMELLVSLFGKRSLVDDMINQLKSTDIFHTTAIDNAVEPVSNDTQRIGASIDGVSVDETKMVPYVEQNHR